METQLLFTKEGVKQSLMKYFRENYLAAILVAILAVSILVIALLIVSSDKYEDDISNLRIENKKLQHQLQTSYNTIYDLRNENQECEYFTDEN